MNCKMEFRGRVEGINHRNNRKFKAFLTDKEKKQLFKFLEDLKTADKVDYLVYEK